MSLTLELVNKDAFNRLKSAGKAFDEGAKQFLSTAGQLVVSQAKRESPVDKGQLRQSIQAQEPSKVMGNWQAKVGSGLEYAKYQEHGTGIYGPKGRPITPRNAKMLAFRAKDGRMIFARSVRGSKKREFMKKGIDYAERNIQHAFSAMDSIIQSKL